MLKAERGVGFEDVILAIEMVQVLDDFEQDILDSVENEEWQSKGDMKTRLAELQGFLKHEKKKAVSIRLSENDLYELKRKSLERSTVSKHYSNFSSSIYV